MRHREGSFVPPNCPVDQKGYIPDLRKVPFSLVVENASSHGDGMMDGSEIWVTFGSPGENFDYLNSIDSDAIEVPAGSSVAEKAHQIIDNAPVHGDNPGLRSNEGNPQIEELRQAFCDRVDRCQGVINGECWALGQSAVRQVIEEL